MGIYKETALTYAMFQTSVHNETVTCTNSDAYMNTSTPTVNLLITHSKKTFYHFWKIIGLNLLISSEEKMIEVNLQGHTNKYIA